MEIFFFELRFDVEIFIDGVIWELGGDVRIQVIYVLGYMCGYCVFFVEFDDVFFFVDIDFLGFGFYYGDVWFDFEFFESMIDKVVELCVCYYFIGYYFGVVDYDIFIECIVCYCLRIV